MCLKNKKELHRAQQKLLRLYWQKIGCPYGPKKIFCRTREKFLEIKDNLQRVAWYCKKPTHLYKKKIPDLNLFKRWSSFVRLNELLVFAQIFLFSNPKDVSFPCCCTKLSKKSSPFSTKMMQSQTTASHPALSCPFPFSTVRLYLVLFHSNITLLLSLLELQDCHSISSDVGYIIFYMN